MLCRNGACVWPPQAAEPAVADDSLDEVVVSDFVVEPSEPAEVSEEELDDVEPFEELLRLSFL